MTVHPWLFGFQHFRDVLSFAEQRAHQLELNEEETGQFLNKMILVFSAAALEHHDLPRETRARYIRVKLRRFEAKFLESIGWHSERARIKPILESHRYDRWCLERASIMSDLDHPPGGQSGRADNKSGESAPSPGRIYFRHSERYA